MKCNCNKYPDNFYYDNPPNGSISFILFNRNLEKIETGNWLELHKCKRCNQLWSVDAWDKYQIQIVTRIHNKENWETHDSTNGRKALLLESRGGNTDEKCIHANCSNQRIKGVVHCVDHLYEMGHRK